MNEAKINNGVDSDYQKGMQQQQAKQMQRENQKNNYYLGLKNDIMMKDIQMQMEAQHKEMLRGEVRQQHMAAMEHEEQVKRLKHE